MNRWGDAMAISSESVSSPASRPIHMLTVDLEDWHHAFMDMEPEVRKACPERIVISTETLLEYFEENKIIATFFVLGELAERHPRLIRKIAESGHELASHAQTHTPLYRMKKTEFQEVLHRSRQAIQEASDFKVTGFRAPWFSITPKTEWALDVIAEAGFEYDASLFPIRTGYYGFPGIPRGIHRRVSPSGAEILEVPVVTSRLMGLKIPVTGGFYLRNIPFFIFKYLLRKISREGLSTVFHVHPWEFDPHPPTANGVSWKEGVIHNWGLGRSAKRLESLFNEFSFKPIRANLVDGGWLAP